METLRNQHDTLHAEKIAEERWEVMKWTHKNPHATGSYAVFDNMTWPRPEGETLGLIEWDLRHTKYPMRPGQRSLVASVLASYRAMVAMSRDERQRVVKALRLVEK